MAKRPDDIAELLARARPRPGRKWLWATLVLVVLAGGGGAFWLRADTTKAVVSYVTAGVERSDLTVTITATGTVQPTTEVEVSSELAGTLATVEVDYNDPVTVGQVLARLDTEKIAAQVANAEAQLASARARLTQAEASAVEAAANLATQAELAARGVTTRKDMIGVEAADARAKAAVEMARADLTLAEANLDLQKADLEKAVIRSPINGVVLDRRAEAGQIVGPNLNDPLLFTLAEDLTRMELLANVDEADIGQVAVGQKAAFTVDAHDGTDFAATITQVRFAPETTDDVVTYKAVLSVENPDLLLRPGMTATATITVAEASGVLVVPNAALRYAPPRASSSGGASGLAGLVLPVMPGRNAGAGLASGKSLWVLRGGQAVEVEVALGATDGKRTIIASGGLAEGDQVITDQEARAN